MKLKPPTLLRGRKVRSLVAATVAIAGFSALALAQTTTAAHADPTEVLVATGSDTIQDVYNQFATDLSGNLLGSYDAVNPVTQAPGEIITPADGSSGTKCSFNRPNGSGQGISALRDSMNPGSTVVAGGSNVLTGSAIPQPGCVDIARSSSGVSSDKDGSVSNQSNTGPIVYIPFAIDAVAGATGGTTTAASYSYTYLGATDNTQHTVTVNPVASLITHADDFSLVNLINLYKNCSPVTVDGVTYDPTGATGTKIDLYVPQSGSGTAKFWAQTLGGFSLTSLPSCVHQTIVGGPLATATGGVPVEEHNGTPMTSDPNGFGPFSAAQWIAQRNGHNDRRHNAIIHSLINCTNVNSTSVPATGTCGTPPTADISPFNNGNSATGILNTNFPITREVFSVASFARVTSAADPLSSLLNATDGSFLCGEQATILNYGFALDPNCGEVIASNRALD